jgi:hypothetical protein
MRKLMAMPIAGLLALALAAPVAAGPNVSNTSGGGDAAYGEWSAEGVFGYVYVAQENGQPGWGDLYQERGEWVPCETGGEIVGQDTTPGDEPYGFRGTRTWGFASDVEITFSGRLASGSATGTFDLYTETVDECAGIYGGDADVQQSAFQLALTGESSIANFRGSGSYQMPSEFNGHYNYRGKERSANGTLVAGSVIDATFEHAYMSQYTWSEHSNS